MIALVLGLGVLGVFALVLMLAIAGAASVVSSTSTTSTSTRPATTRTAPATTRTPSLPATTRARPSTPTTTAPVTSAPVTTRPASPAPTRTPPASTPPTTRSPAAPVPPPQGGYRNEDYRVPSADPSPPDIPYPASASDADRWLRTNPIYRQRVAEPVRCDLPEIDITAATDAQLKSYIENQMACMMRVWAPALADTNTWTMYRPTVRIYGNDVETPCGKWEGANAIYCGANQVVYYSREVGRSRAWSAMHRPKMVDALIAHEFGHAIQGRTGIMGARGIQWQAAPSTAEKLLIMRRTEVQADCFSAQWLRSVAHSRGYSDAERRQFLEAFASLGDDRLAGLGPGAGDHGQGTTRRRWAQEGLGTSEVGRCSTWSAPRGDLQ